MTESEEGQRLDNFLASRLKGVPRSRLYRIIRKGEVRINGSRCKPATRIARADIIRVPPLRLPQKGDPPPIPASLRNLDRNVIYEDQDLLVIDKPSGAAVHGGSGLSMGIIEALKQSEYFKGYLELAHRLDRETSGCLVLARNRVALTRLHEMLRRDHGAITKIYTALVAGNLPRESRRIDVPLQRYREAGSGQSRVRVHKDGRASLTLLEPRLHFQHATLVRLSLLTGRMHQARAHCRHIGHPVLGDPIYGDFEMNRRFESEGLKRLFLHASELGFPHPRSNKPLRISAPLPPELEKAIRNLG